MNLQLAGANNDSITDKTDMKSPDTNISAANPSELSDEEKTASNAASELLYFMERYNDFVREEFWRSGSDHDDSSTIQKVAPSN